MLSTYSVQLVQCCTEQLLAHALQVCLQVQERETVKHCCLVKAWSLLFEDLDSWRATVVVCMHAVRGHMLQSDVDGYLISAL